MSEGLKEKSEETSRASEKSGEISKGMIETSEGIKGMSKDSREVSDEVREASASKPKSPEGNKGKLEAEVVEVEVIVVLNPKSVEIRGCLQRRTRGSGKRARRSWWCVQRWNGGIRRLCGVLVS